MRCGLAMKTGAARTLAPRAECLTGAGRLAVGGIEDNVGVAEDRLGPSARRRMVALIRASSSSKANGLVT